MQDEQILLGFDFGTKSIGMAVGQTMTCTATPLTAIKSVEGKPLWATIREIINEWNPDALVVGIPLDLEGKDLSVTAQAKVFAEELHQHFHLPVYEADEQLTTKEAKAILYERSGFRSLSKQNVDALSATLILESWMRTHQRDMVK